MRKSPRAQSRFIEEEEQDESLPSRMPRKDMLALAAAALACGAIGVNALFLQHGMHPAPFFVNKPVRVVSTDRVTAPSTPALQAVTAPLPAPLERAAPAPDRPAERTNTVAPPVVMPRPRPTEAEPAKAETSKPEPPKAEARSRGDIIADIQRELARRHFYDGPADGFYGPKTDGAIRDFEQATKMKLGEPSEAMLQAIVRAPAKAAAATPAVDTPRPPDPIGEMLAPSKRVTAVQRVLSDYGYAQLKPTGQIDRPTQEAIEQFERTRKMPVTGEVTPRLMRELSAMTGRPLE